MALSTVLFVLDVFAIAALASAAQDFCDQIAPGVRTALMFHLVINTLTMGIFMFDLRASDVGVKSDAVRIFFLFYNLMTTISYLILVPLSMVPMIRSILRGGFVEQFGAPARP